MPIATQVAAGSVAGAVGLLVVTGTVEFWMALVLAFANGCVSAFDAPARQLYVVDLVGRDRSRLHFGGYDKLPNAGRPHQ